MKERDGDAFCSKIDRNTARSFEEEETDSQVKEKKDSRAMEMGVEEGKERDVGKDGEGEGKETDSTAAV